MKVMVKCFLAVVFVAIFAVNSPAEAVRGNLDCEFQVKKLVYRQYSGGRFNHSMYYANINDCKTLIILCHGGVRNGTYGVIINGEFRTDYSNAVSELISHYDAQGKFDSINGVDIVLLGTCHAGYASSIILPQYAKLPKYGIPLVTVIDYKGKLFFKEFSGSNGRVSLRLYTDKTYKEPASRHSTAMANFFGGSNVRGYRAVGELGEIPDDAVELADDF